MWPMSVLPGISATLRGSVKHFSYGRGIRNAERDAPPADCMVLRKRLRRDGERPKYIYLGDPEIRLQKMVVDKLWQVG